MFVVALASAVSGRQSASAPAPKTGGICPVAVYSMLPITGDARATRGRDFEAFLISPTIPGVASGTLWVNASGRSYHVPFANRSVLSRRIEGSLDPIVFHLPQDAALESAFVDSLDGPGAGPCDIEGLWLPQATKKLAPQFLENFRAAKRDKPAVIAVPIEDPAAVCQAHDLPATRLVAGPDAPRQEIDFTSREPHTPIPFAITLNADSSVKDVVTRDGRAGYGWAFDKIRGIGYRTAIHNCQSEAATYEFTVDFLGRQGNEYKLLPSDYNLHP